MFTKFQTRYGIDPPLLHHSHPNIQRTIKMRARLLYSCPNNPISTTYQINPLHFWYMVIRSKGFFLHPHWYYSGLDPPPPLWYCIPNIHPNHNTRTSQKFTTIFTVSLYHNSSHCHAHHYSKDDYRARGCALRTSKMYSKRYYYMYSWYMKITHPVFK